jgi:3-hydroxybutyryl-CoA dehydratase
VTSAEFKVDIGADAAQSFASLSGDWNPVHTDEACAAETRFPGPIRRGAFLARLVSRMAGMFLPGTACLLHSIRRRFNAPVQVVVRGTVVSDDVESGRTEVTIVDATTGTLYAEASYEFSRHEHTEGDTPAPAATPKADSDTGAPILVTGVSGAFGAAVVEALGDRAVGLSRAAGEHWLQVPDLEVPGAWAALPARIDDIVHCGWPPPDNQGLLALPQPRAGVEHNLAAPVRQILALARLLAERGTPGAELVLVGSTAAEPGPHNCRMPLCTLAKSLVPTLTRVLALELAPADLRCIAVTFNVIDGGMNEALSARARVMNVDRSPFGRIPTPADAAAQIARVLDNRGFLAWGATLSLTGGAIP